MSDDKVPAAGVVTAAAKPKAARSRASAKAARAIPLAVAGPDADVAQPVVTDQPQAETAVAAVLAAGEVSLPPQELSPALALADASAPLVEAEPIAETGDLRGSETMTDQTQTFETAKVATDRFQAAFGDVTERTRAMVEKGSKFFEEASELTRGNVEAVVASSRIAAKGVEGLGHEAADYGRRSFEEVSSLLKSFAEVKSPAEFLKLQSDYARSAFDSFVAETSKVSESMFKLATDVSEPITGRYAVAVEKVKALAA